jgi:hypothetical protein
MAVERELMEFQDFSNDWREKQQRAAERRRDAARQRALDAKWSEEYFEILES